MIRGLLRWWSLSAGAQRPLAEIPRLPKFKDGDVLKASYINKIMRRISRLEERV